MIQPSPMLAADFDRGGTLRAAADARRFISTLWLISIVAIVLGVLTLAYRGFSLSADYLEDVCVWAYDAAIYGLAAFSFGRGRLVERTATLMLAATLSLAGCQGLYELWRAVAPHTQMLAESAPFPATIVAAGACVEAALLYRFSACDDPLMRATWYSARNSAFLGLAGVGTLLLSQGASAAWPQMVVDSCDILLAFQAAAAIVLETFE